MATWHGGIADAHTKSQLIGTLVSKPTLLTRQSFFCLPHFILWGFGFETVGKRLYPQLDGTVISSRTLVSWGRRATEYVLRGCDGHEITYVAGPTDASLPRNLPIGTYVKKQRWSLSYVQNGQTVDDFNYLFYTAILCGAFALAAQSLWMWL